MTKIDPFENDQPEDIKVHAATYEGERIFLQILFVARALIAMPGFIVTKREENLNQPMGATDHHFAFTIPTGTARGNYSFRFRVTSEEYRVGIAFEYVDEPVCEFLRNHLPMNHVWWKGDKTPWGGNYPDPKAASKRFNRWFFSLATITVIGYATLQFISYLKG